MIGVVFPQCIDVNTVDLQDEQGGFIDASFIEQGISVVGVPKVVFFFEIGHWN